MTHQCKIIGLERRGLTSVKEEILDQFSVRQNVYGVAPSLVLTRELV